VSLSTLKIPTAHAFEPLLAPARYKGAFGGRGSGKSHFFGELLVETCQAERGTLAVCIREAQRTLAQSSKRLIESKIAALGLGHGFKPFNDKIETPGDGLIIFRGMHSDTTDNIASANNFIKSGYRLYQPQFPWGWPHTLYWRKVIGSRDRAWR
jgi:phage terminase large subunit